MIPFRSDRKYWYVYVPKDGAEKETNIPSAGGWRSEVTLHLPLGI